MVKKNVNVKFVGVDVLLEIVVAIDDVAFDCGDNEGLFLAIAAIRDDTDKNQWFILDTRLGSINYLDSLIQQLYI